MTSVEERLDKLEKSLKHALSMLEAEGDNRLLKASDSLIPIVLQESVKATIDLIPKPDFTSCKEFKALEKEFKGLQERFGILEKSVLDLVSTIKQNVDELVSKSGLDAKVKEIAQRRSQVQCRASAAAQHRASAEASSKKVNPQPPMAQDSLQASRDLATSANTSTGPEEFGAQARKKLADSQGKKAALRRQVKSSALKKQVSNAFSEGNLRCTASDKEAAFEAAQKALQDRSKRASVLDLMPRQTNAMKAFPMPKSSRDIVKASSQVDPTKVSFLCGGVS